MLKRDWPDRAGRPGSIGWYHAGMSTTRQSWFQKAVLLAVAAIPWILAMYLFHWLDVSGTWTTDTPHRGKMSVALLGAGMVVSFLLHSWLAGRER